MATLTPNGASNILGILADLHEQVVSLSDALAAEQQAHADLRQQFDALTHDRVAPSGDGSP